MSTSKGQRATALIFAIVFFASTVAFTGVILWQATQSDDEINQATQTQEPKENQLQGTKLQGFGPIDKVDSLQKVDLTEGTGAEVQPGATITAHYTGALVKDGTIFESSHDRGEPATFPLGQVIAGWTQGVPGMKVGGKRRLIIPAAMAYGEQGSPPKIGPNEPLVFDIELVSIQ